MLFVTREEMKNDSNRKASVGEVPSQEPRRIGVTSYGGGAVRAWRRPANLSTQTAQ